MKTLKEIHKELISKEKSVREIVNESIEKIKNHEKRVNPNLDEAKDINAILGLFSQKFIEIRKCYIIKRWPTENANKVFLLINFPFFKSE